MEVFGWFCQRLDFGDVDIIPRLDMLERNKSANFEPRVQTRHLSKRNTAIKEFTMLEHILVIPKNGG